MQDLAKTQKELTDLAKGIIESGMDFMPVCFLVLPSGTLQICGMVFRDDDEKKHAYRAISKQAKAQKAVAIISIQDAWTIVRPPEWEPGSERPRDAPDRVEALAVSLIMPDGSIASFVSHPYHRDGKKITWDKEHDCGADGEHGEGKQFFLPAWGELGAAQ